MNSFRWLLASLAMLGLLCLTSAAEAARLVRIKISLDGKVVLEGYYGDNGRQDAATVWTYLDKAEFEPADGFRLEPNKDDPNTATLNGKIVVEVQYSGQAAGGSLNLVRSKTQAGQWRLAAGERERLGKPGAPAAPAPNAAAAAVPEYGFAVGKRLPFTVIDFVNPKGHGHCGCVSVMIRNQRSRGVVVFTRSLDDSVIELCRRLEQEELIPDGTQGFLVVFGRSVDSLKQPTADWGLTRFTVNSAREKSGKWPSDLKLPSEAKIAVCTINYAPITFAFSTNEDRLTAEQQAEIAAAVRELNAQPLKVTPRVPSPPAENPQPAE